MDQLSLQIGKNVRQARERRDISQESLAHLSGIDRSYMSRIERGIARVTVHKIYLIAATLNCDLKELLPSREDILD